MAEEDEDKEDEERNADLKQEVHTMMWVKRTVKFEEP